MPPLLFENEATRQAHPQARLVNAYLMEHVFKNTLTEQEINVLKDYKETIKSIHFNAMDSVAKQKIILCLLLVATRSDTSKLIAYCNNIISYQAIAQQAALAGRIDILESLKSPLGVAGIKPVFEDRAVFCSAASQGNVENLTRILTFNINPQLQARELLIPTEYRYLYNEACRGGHFSIIDYLEKHCLTHPMTIIKADDYAAYRYACLSGNLAIIQHLEKSYLKNNTIDAIRARNYSAYINACISGQLPVVKALDAQLSLDVTFTTTKSTVYKEAYFKACEMGHLMMVQHLECFLSKQEMAAHIKENNYKLFYLVCEKGHVNILQRLEMQLNMRDINEAVESWGYYAFRKASENNHFDITNHLLKNVFCFDYAENHDNEYGTNIIYPFVNNKLAALTKQKLDFERTKPNDVFDIKPEEELLYLYILRNLIRRGVARDNRNAENLNDVLCDLIHIPRIKNSCHMPFSSVGHENELLIFALSQGNQPAASILLTVPKVREIAGRENFHRQVINGDINIRQLWKDSDSAMTALTQNEQRRLGRITAKYEPQQKQKGGVEKVFDELIQKLAAKYDSSPSNMTTQQGKLIKLPMQWSAFNALNLSATDKEKALKAYYQNPVHTAWRYLSKPNPWIAQDSSLVNVNPNDTTQRWSTFEEYKGLITLMYLATMDATSKPIDGHTIDTRFDHFIKELALIGRAHNWDRTRTRVSANGTKITEEFDDLEPDKPSCYSGVKRRLFQSLIGHELASIVTSETIYEEIRTFVRAEMLKKMSSAVLSTDKLQTLLIDYYRMIIEGNFDPMNFELVNISSEQKNKFKQYLLSKYSAAIHEFQMMVDETLSESPEGDYLKNCSRFGLDNMFQTELEKRVDGAYVKIKNERNTDKIVDYLMIDTRPTSKSDNNRSPYLIDLMLLPGLSKELLTKLNPSQLARSLYLNNPMYEAALHRLLQLDTDNFIAMMTKLETKDLLTLLTAKNNSVPFIDNVLTTMDLKGAFKAYLLSQAGINKLLGNELTTPDVQQAGALSSSQFGVLAAPQDSQLKQARTNLANALISAQKRLTSIEVQLLTNQREIDTAMTIIAKTMGIEKADLYQSVMSNTLSKRI